jgi:aspartokinase/homoserine dehydrogenase 1
VQWEESTAKLSKWIATVDDEAKASNRPIPHLMITGYVASTLDGVATTLKRDGSDFSASIFGKMLRSTGITIWTDVSGVYSADPRRVPDAQIIPLVSYTEAIELAYFGAKVIHPKTMGPAIDAQIPIYIRT